MRIISNEVEDCFDECESTYKEMLDEFNKAQKSDQEQIHYERLEFDYKEKNVCQLCLHASKSDRKMGSLLGWADRTIPSVRTCGFPASTK